MIFQKVDVKVAGSQDYAKCDAYFWEKSPELAIDCRPLVIVCPGGGYSFTSDREADPIAMQFLSYGYHVAVLRYSVAPAVFPTAIRELGKVVLSLRREAEQYRIDKNKIILVGFSAGGHMVASYATYWNQPYLYEVLGCEAEELRPNGLILGYPVITAGEFAHRDSIDCVLGDRKGEPDAVRQMSLEYQVTDAVPKCFVWHTYEDGLVPVQNSILWVSALVKAGIPVEFHLFEKGGHGLSLASRLTQSPYWTEIEPTCQPWIELAHQWVENL